MEDSRFALFSEPNAYIQRFDNHKQENKKFDIKKVVFQEPYEVLPDYHLKTDFNNCKNHFDDKPKKNMNKPSFPFSFDIKKFLPLLSGLGIGGGGIDKLISTLGEGEKMNGGTDLISLILGNKDLVSNVLNMFTKNKKPIFQKQKTTDIPIKNYTRVE